MVRATVDASRHPPPSPIRHPPIRLVEPGAHHRRSHGAQAVNDACGVVCGRSVSIARGGPAFTADAGLPRAVWSSSNHVAPGRPGRNVSVSIFHDALKALLGPNVDLPSTDGSEWPIVAPEAAERGGERSGHVLPVGRRGRTTPTSPFERSDRRLRMAVYILGLLWTFRRAALRASLGRGLRRPVSLGAIAWPEVASFRLDHGCCSRW